ncbi:MAG: preprotein translocase subunit SecG [Bacteroidetes bacterium]|nr:preprotein translocase subunit SecG [Bacteroidota bacterium]
MIFSILIILISVLLTLVVLVQNSKGGGIQSQFGAANQIMGVKRGTEVIEKATWALAIALILISVVMAPKGGNTINSDDDGSSVKKRAQSAVGVPSAPVQNQPSQPGQPK